MEYNDYAMQYFLCIMKITLMQEKMVCAPKNGPDWLVKLIDYLLSEFANSRDGLYAVAQAFLLNDDFSALKVRLLGMEIAEFEDANEKTHWKEQ